ncbi:unnamed protein product [Strongylus vulgaris]|uniref:C6 domain-containing protein n=1 Tax=Strongylus vulgaris TaxID=40348 RepID=A0A3P7LCY3_STRVU|nr:unnamed protein product [Strongylus vulgaris]
MSTTYAPGDPKNPCNQCSREIYVSPQMGQEGSTYMDFRYGDCLKVLIFCQPLKDGLHVDLLENGKSVELTASTVNRTLTCTDDLEWMDTQSQLIISNVTCLMRDG